MALVTFAPLVQSISGQLGGVVFHTGKRTNVIAAAPSRTKNRSAQQERRRWLFNDAARIWKNQAQGYRDEWTTFAARWPLPNKFGVRRTLTPYQCFMAYNITTDPMSHGATGARNAPRGPCTETPMDFTADFTAGGPFNITATAPNYSTLLLYVFARRHAEFGTRGAPDCTRFIQIHIWTSATHDLYAAFTAADFDLPADEQVEIRAHFQRPYLWPGFSVTTTITVA